MLAAYEHPSTSCLVQSVHPSVCTLHIHETALAEAVPSKGPVVIAVVAVVLLGSRPTGIVQLYDLYPPASEQLDPTRLDSTRLKFNLPPPARNGMNPNPSIHHRQLHPGPSALSAPQASPLVRLAASPALGTYRLHGLDRWARPGWAAGAGPPNHLSKATLASFLPVGALSRFAHPRREQPPGSHTTRLAPDTSRTTGAREEACPVMSAQRILAPGRGPASSETSGQWAWAWAGQGRGQGRASRGPGRACVEATQRWSSSTLVAFPPLWALPIGRFGSSMISVRCLGWPLASTRPGVAYLSCHGPPPLTRDFIHMIGTLELVYLCSLRPRFSLLFATSRLYRKLDIFLRESFPSFYSQTLISHLCSAQHHSSQTALLFLHHSYYNYQTPPSILSPEPKTTLTTLYSLPLSYNSLIAWATCIIRTTTSTAYTTTTNNA
ncbi:hypothetical protein V8C26DRAFT_34204 [Trichoderma gracile]